MLLLALALMTSSSLAPDLPEIREGLSISGVSRAGRIPIPVDAVQAAIARGTWAAPHEGEALALPGGRSAVWRKVVADKDGNIPAGSYLWTDVQSPLAQTVLLAAAGHGMVYANGEPHAGDPYGYGYLHVPVRLRAGSNEFLFAGAGRGPIRVKLLPMRAPVMLDLDDPTTPDILTTDKGTVFGAVVVINGTESTLRKARVTASIGEVSATTSVPEIPPMSQRKVRVDLPVPASPKKGDAEFTLALDAGGAKDTAKLKLRIMNPNEVHKRTFVSSMDGSVQYYAVNPAQKPSKSNMLVLSVHGASVEALGQAQAYASHDDWTLVAPTNRRPYGFDWEDWGRLDALEVLDIAEKTIPHDPTRVVLTGHSMGGHGTWHLGLTFPDRFAAIGPSAGWSSFFSYGGSPRIAPSDGMATILARAMAPSDTLWLIRNSSSEKVYILHGDADDNVPVTEARTMRDALRVIRSDVQYHEQPGAGHWWGTDQGPGWGSACVDWKPMFEMFQAARLPADRDVKYVDFSTADPAVSGRFHWVTIEQQVHPMRLSHIVLQRVGKKIEGSTSNVATLRFDLRALGGVPERLVLDGNDAEMAFDTGVAPAVMVAHLRKGKWVCDAYREVDGKSSRRGGPFKQAFTRNMVFVYGTKGNAEENAWAFAKARFDAEQWQYRGNGAVDVIPDTSLDPRSRRNVILYGNADTNAAWGKVLKDCPISVRRGTMTVGSRTLSGDDLGCAFLYPKAGDPAGLVGVVSGTGLAGLRTVQRLPVFSAGIALPDWIVIGADALERGIGGFRGAGYFGNDWGVDSGDSAHR